jgi:hypothetical protein
MSQHPILIFLISPDSAHLAENGTFQTAYGKGSPQFDLTGVNQATRQEAIKDQLHPGRTLRSVGV